MCGIAGYFGEREIPDERVRTCLSLMRRRGPDHQAHRHWVNPAGRHVHLLHARLSIIDLDERAHQPFAIGSRWLVFNGELYNYVELRKELEAAGRAFRTQSDTEVLLSVIERDGWDGLDRCEGMWAAAVYDEAAGTLGLARDRFGEKPLYLARDATGLYFGSEPKFIFALMGRTPEIDRDHVCRYLVNGYKALYKGGRCFFRGLSELPPASILRINPDGREERSSCWAPRFAPDSSMTYGAAVEAVRAELIRSVRMRLRADVPLAFCMSGGVDSNALISIAKRELKYDVHGFTIVNTDARYDEQEMVDASVAELGIRHTSIPVSTADFLPRLRTLVRYHDAPVYTITYYAHWLLMESVAAQGYRISISGTAADELFSGYYDHHLAYLYEIRGDAMLHGESRRRWEEKVRPFVRNAFLKDPDAFIRNPGMRDHIFLDAEEFSGLLRRPWSEPFSEAPFSTDLLRNRMLNEMFHETVPVVLHEDDLNAMYFSIENRSPYLDRRLFETCYRIPTRHLVRGGLAKAVLRDAVAGILPEAVRVSPRKVGFNAPVFSFLDARNPEIRAAILDDSPIYDVVRREPIEELLRRDDLPNSRSKFLFYFLSAKLFMEEFR